MSMSKLRAWLASYPDWILDETAGLNIEQLAFAAQEPGWARWSIDLQVRHMAMGAPNWLYLRGRDTVRAAGYDFPPTAETLADIRRAKGRHVPPEVAPHREAIISLMRPWSELCCAIFDRESPEGLAAKLVGDDSPYTRYADVKGRRPGDPKEQASYNRILVRLHPSGFTEDSHRPGAFTVNLGAGLRTIYWEILAHLRNIQRIKKLLGLPAVLELPREGYLTIPEFYD